MTSCIENFMIERKLMGVERATVYIWIRFNGICAHQSVFIAALWQLKTGFDLQKFSIWP